jgi:hypothetical protein
LVLVVQAVALVNYLVRQVQTLCFLQSPLLVVVAVQVAQACLQP